MNKASFRWAFLALLATSLTGCASPMQLFSKKTQSYEDFRADRAEKLAKRNQPVAGSQSGAVGQIEIAELLHKGHDAFQQGNLPEAQTNYFAVVQRQPNHSVANHRLGVIADRQQDFQSAQRYYLTALQASPRDANLLNDVGYSFLLQSRYAEAEQYLQSALRVNGTQSNAINNLGLLYAKQGQADRALAMFRRTNSEAEAQAKLARLLPSGMGAATSPATMLAQNQWAIQNSMNPPPVWNGGPNGDVVGAPIGQSQPNGFAPNGFVPNNANGPWSSTNPAMPNGSSSIAQAGASFPAPSASDPNNPDASRVIRDMEVERRKALAERQARDFAERQRIEIAARRLRDEEFGRSNAGTPNHSPPSDSNRWNYPPNGGQNVAPNSSANPNVTADWANRPNGSRQPGYADLIPSSVPNTPANLLPNATRGPMPPSGAGSPLDAMPAWPPADAASMNVPNNSTANTASWPNVVPSGAIEDPARAAARLGMSGGPGNMFPITPGPTSSPANSPNWPSATNWPNNGSSPSGVAPTTPPNWPANSNPPPNYGPAMGEPPAGSFGPGNFNSSSNSRSQPSANDFSQDQLPPSGLYQTPNRFGLPPAANSLNAQPASFGTNSTASGGATAQNRSTNSAGSNHGQPTNATSGGNQWRQGQPPGTQSSLTSAPTIQGFLPTTVGDNSLSEYERMIQLHNAETDRIRQQLDAQRQLPGSENYSTFGRQ